MNAATAQKQIGIRKAFGKNAIRSRKRSEKIADAVSLVLIVVLAALVMLPIWWMIRSSLMKSLEIFRWPPQFFPKEWLFSNYNIKPTTFDFWRYLGNTLSIVAPCVVFGTITAIFCGYAFARLRFRGKAFLFSL